MKMPAHHNSRVKDTCYMCENLASTREHVPPRCFFPEKKDLPPGCDFKRKLITVPSCVEHNIEKSGDDFYIFLVILSLGGNLAAQRQFATKAMRAFRRKPSILRLLKNPRPVLYDWQQTMAFELDKNRFDRSIEHLAKALYYYHHGIKWQYQFQTISSEIISTGGINPTEVNNIINNLNIKVAGFLEDLPIHGENPEIFTYKMFADESQRKLLIRMVFYENTAILAISWPH
jgi:hypothetical protein